MSNQPNNEEMSNCKMELTIQGGKSFTATLADNPAADALKERLEKGALTIEMEDYAGMEKVGELDEKLPRCDSQIETEAGDLILYQGRYFVIYYAHNSWSLTRLGKIDRADAQELREALGSSDVTVTLSLKRETPNNHL